MDNLAQVTTSEKGINGIHSKVNRLSVSQADRNWPINFSPLLSERLDLYRLTTFASNKNLPIHSWFPYLQGYSAALVEMLLHEFKIDRNKTILDPWCGVGTTNVVCSQQGINNFGVDISPLAVFVAETKLAGIPPISLIQKQLNRIEKRLKDTSNLLPLVSRFDIVNRCIPPMSLSHLNVVKETIREIENRKIADFLLLALLSSLPSLSIFKKDGAHYRYISAPESKDVFGVFKRTVDKFLVADESFQKSVENQKVKSLLRVGDSRSLSVDNNSIDSVVTSPPYLNRDNYIAQHKLDLMFGDFVNDFNHYRVLTHSTLRSHVEAKDVHNFQKIDLEVIDVYLKTLEERREDLNNDKIIDMVRGYFIDMFYSLREIGRVLKRKGRVAIVIGNSSWAGVSIEVDKVLATMARQIGLTPTDILVTRYKLNSAQQIVKYGKIPIRESILLLEKR